MHVYLWGTKTKESAHWCALRRKTAQFGSGVGGGGLVDLTILYIKGAVSNSEENNQ